MTRTITAQAVSIALSVLVTVCTLMALNGLATTEHAAMQQAAAAAAARA
jgi:ABC-type phosphate transport system auxiliary subunit